MLLNSKLVDEWVLLGFLTGISVRGYLQEQKWLKDSCITKAHPSMGDSSQSWEPGAHCTACRQLNRLESVLSRCLSWSKLLPDSWYEGGSFESLLCSSASFHLRGTLSFYCSLAGKEPSESDQLQGPFWDLLLPSCLRGFLSDQMKGGMVQCFNIGGTLRNWYQFTKD